MSRLDVITVHQFSNVYQCLDKSICKKEMPKFFFKQRIQKSIACICKMIITYKIIVYWFHNFFFNILFYTDRYYKICVSTLFFLSYAFGLRKGTVQES